MGVSIKAAVCYVVTPGWGPRTCDIDASAIAGANPLSERMCPSTLKSMIGLFTPPQGWEAAATETLGIELWRIPFVIAAAIVIYIAFLVLVRLFGTRVLSTMSSFDAVVIVMFGAVAGRVIIGNPPSVTTGIIGLTTLMIMEAIFGAVQHVVGFRRTIDAQPQVIMAHGEFLPDAMRRTHVTHKNLCAALRQAGVAHKADVQCVILEPNGKLSVIREGTVIDPDLLIGVHGHEYI